MQHLVLYICLVCKLHLRGMVMITLLTQLVSYIFHFFRVKAIIELDREHLSLKLRMVYKLHTRNVIAVMVSLR